MRTGFCIAIRRRNAALEPTASRFCAAPGGALWRPVHHERHPTAVLSGLAEGQGARSADDRPGAGGADPRPHDRGSAGRARGRPARRLARGHYRNEFSGRRGLRAGGLGRRRARDPVRLRLGVARAHPGDAAIRDLCAQGPWPARPRLWAGAAVGLGGLHRRHFRRRLCHRYDPGAAPDLADRGREFAQRAGGADAGAACRRPRRRARRPRRASICCAIQPSSPCWRRRA